MNILLLVMEAIIIYFIVLIIFKKYSYNGIKSWMVMATILSNLVVIKSINVNGVEIVLGLILNASIFVANNIILQKKGKEEGKRTIIMLAYTTIISYLILTLTAILTPSEFMLDSNISFNNLYGINIRMFLSYNIPLIIGLLININLYYFIRREKNTIWISNITSFIIVQFIETILFVIILYTGIYNITEIIFIIVIEYIIKVLFGIISTRILYLTND